MSRNQMDKLKLEYLIKTHGYTIEAFCKEVGISRSAYYQKCNPDSGAEFTLGEIQRIMDALGLDTPMGIFFTEKVS